MTTSLREDYTIDTPENVTFGYEIAGIGSRFIGAVIDTGIIGVLLTILNFALITLLELTGDLREIVFNGLESPNISQLGGLVLALFALLNFAVFWGYYMLFELVWNGQTPGKRAAKTRVLRVDGSPTRTSEVAVRNLVRIVDWLPGMYTFGFIVMFFNRQSRRLGDYAAGTLVIRERAGVNLDTLLTTAPPLTAISPEQAAALRIRFPTVRRLSDGDYQVIRQALARTERNQVDRSLLDRLARVIAMQMGETLPAGADPAHYLRNAAAAYEVATQEPMPPA